MKHKVERETSETPKALGGVLQQPVPVAPQVFVQTVKKVPLGGVPTGEGWEKHLISALQRASAETYIYIDFDTMTVRPRPSPWATRGQIVALLQSGRAKIQRGWTSHAWAMDKAGNALSPRSLDAVSWCLVGAMGSDDPDFALDHDRHSVLAKALRYLSGACHMHPVTWNDQAGRTQAEALHVYDRAIAMAENG